VSLANCYVYFSALRDHPKLDALRAPMKLSTSPMSIEQFTSASGRKAQSWLAIHGVGPHDRDRGRHREEVTPRVVDFATAIVVSAARSAPPFTLGLVRRSSWTRSPRRLLSGGQDDDFKFLELLRPSAQHHELEKPANRPVAQRQEHEASYIARLRPNSTHKPSQIRVGVSHQDSDPNLCIVVSRRFSAAPRRSEHRRSTAVLKNYLPCPSLKRASCHT
jgi:hypothetical protein